MWSSSDENEKAEVDGAGESDSDQTLNELCGSREEKERFQ